VARPTIGRATAATIAVAAFLAAFGALHFGFYARGVLMDTPVYERYGDAIVHGASLPYRDFGVEYPPGALAVFAPPSLVAGKGEFAVYRQAFEWLMLLCGAAAAAIVGVVTRRAAPALFAGLAPLLLGPVVVSRFDLWPALLAVGGLAAVARGRPRLGSLVLGLAFAAKIYPGVLVPLAVAFVWRRRGRREAVICAAVAAGAAAAVFLPFVVLSPHGVWSSISGQASRPLQIESLGAALLLGAHQAWGLPLEQVNSHGSDNLGGATADWLAAAHGLVAPLVVLALWIAFARGEATRRRLFRFAAAAVCAFVVFGKVLSPQYLIWLIPLVPLVRSRAAWALFAAALLLTQLWFPHRYLDLAYGFDPRASWLVLARDLVLVALLLVLVWPKRALVAAVVAAAAAATGAAAAGVAATGGQSHSRILEENGIASTCSARKAVPGTTAATVRFVVHGYENTASTPACVTVTIRAHGGRPLFSAAYRDGFDPADPGRGYLGDPGTCSNVAQHPSSTLRYAFRVPANTRFAVEIEHCTSARTAPAYSISVAITDS
jgi:hypothetical protein